ncbi:hypothetical protein K6U20_11810 [Vibrio fluvialis]|uniref:IS66 family insertion sequence element accessory protein TnpA n=1 Tax=Vibrio fluvialis TaxID=676 RepID=UPI001EEBA733|nr:hypothetical protein [Vibrio fluvialis]MCG6405308.1 hypothetical protein [Vibrio fluvialis]
MVGKRITKTQWQAHAKEWALSGLSVAKYCALHRLTVSTARAHLKSEIREKILSETEAPQNVDTQGSQPGLSSAKSPKSRKQPKAKSRTKGGAPKGNKNAYIHGLMTQTFGGLVAYAEQADDEFKINLMRCAQLQALEHHVKYKADLVKLNKEIEDKGPDYKLTELDIDSIDRLEKYAKSCFDQAIYYATKEIQIVNQFTNIEATKAAEVKIRAQVEQIKVDTRLKEKGIVLAEAKTKQAKAQTELTRMDLDARRKESLGDDEDLGMTLDEVLELGDDEILDRFKQGGGELGFDDD